MATVANLLNEIDIVKQYLPEMASDSEIETAVKALMAQLGDRFHKGIAIRTLAGMLGKHNASNISKVVNKVLTQSSECV